VNPFDWHILRADVFFIRFFFGLLKPKQKILGADMAGRIEAIGERVEQFQPGDEVFCDLSASNLGAFAEYVCARADTLALKPANLTFEEAAAVPLASITALQALRDRGRIKAGHKVLINGASGGVGTFAVQIAKSYDAEVTAICSSRNAEMVRTLGADQVIDYAREDVTRGGQQFDVILAASGHHSIWDYRRILSPGGRYVAVGGSGAQVFQANLLGPGISMVGSKKMGAMIMKPNAGDLDVMKGLLEAGKVTPIIDRRYPLEQVADAIRYLEEGHARGKVVIEVATP
jgi:NADPH:quinone reductase-like Zn-dependent oxidoreductase